MCDVDYDEVCDVWEETRPKARKLHRCVVCRETIWAGEVYLRVGSFYDGEWSTTKVHLTCEKLTKYIALTVCGQQGYSLESDLSLRENVREHMHEAPELLRMYRDHMRERNRLEKELA